MTSPFIPNKRRVEAYAQGDLDGLCGIYAIINAFRALCPEVDDSVGERLFRFLVRSIDQRHERSDLSVIFGVNSTMLNKLLASGQAYLRRQLKIEVRLERPGRRLRSRSIDVVWERLMRAFDDNTVMILPLEGCCNHWTVVYDARPRKLRLIDSDLRRSIKRTCCTLTMSSTLYRLNLSGVISIKRIARKG